MAVAVAAVAVAVEIEKSRSHRFSVRLGIQVTPPRNRTIVVKRKVCRMVRIYFSASCQRYPFRSCVAIHKRAFVYDMIMLIY